MEIKIGDSIKFKAATRWNCGAVWRKVNGFRKIGPSLKPTVRYGGWPNFTVRSDEILGVKSVT